MHSIVKEGEVYIDNEIERIEKLLLNVMSSSNQDELNKKRNVLQQFRYHRKDEL